MITTKTPVNQISTDAILAARNLIHDRNNVTTVIYPEKAPIDISLEKYQEAINYYANHPNLDMHKSYQESLTLCHKLKKAFEAAERLATEVKNVKRSTLTIMEREEYLGLKLTRRIEALKSIQRIIFELKQLKDQRIKYNKKPH